MGFIYWRARTPCDQTREPFGGVALGGDEDADRMDANQRAGAGDYAVRERCGPFVVAGASGGGDACDQFNGHRGEFYVGAGARYGGELGLSGDSLVDWAAAKVPFLQKEIPAIDPGTT